jgi:hypothetical protein
MVEAIQWPFPTVGGAWLAAVAGVARAPRTSAAAATGTIARRGWEREVTEEPPGPWEKTFDSY